MSNVILFVFEGEKTEAQIFESLKSHFLKENKNTILCASYNTVIYKLYKKLKENRFIDLVEELRPNNLSKLSNILRDDISEIYLFFDYDPHATNASDAKLREMLEYFNSETENGKLYISYPMVEAIKHLKIDINFQNTTIAIEKQILEKYKKFVNIQCDPCYFKIQDLTFEHWKTIIEEHCKKLNFIINDSFSFPEKIVEQLDIFNTQLNKYINQKNEVAVLSAFPILLLDYYGVKGLYNQISK